MSLHGRITKQVSRGTEQRRPDMASDTYDLAPQAMTADKEGRMGIVGITCQRTRATELRRRTDRAETTHLDSEGILDCAQEA